MTLPLHVKHANALRVLHLRRVGLGGPPLPAPVSVLPPLPPLAALALRVAPEALRSLPLPVAAFSAAVRRAVGLIRVALVVGGGACHALRAARLGPALDVARGGLGGGVELLLLVLWTELD